MPATQAAGVEEWRVDKGQRFELLELQTKRSTQRAFKFTRTGTILKRVLNICNRYGMKTETHIVVGEANDRIWEAAAKLGAHFLVVGSHEHGTFIGAMKRSVSDYCAPNVVRPVVAVNKKVFS